MAGRGGYGSRPNMQFPVSAGVGGGRGGVAGAGAGKSRVARENEAKL